MRLIQLGVIDYAILIVYFACVLGIGWALWRNVRSSEAGHRGLRDHDQLDRQLSHGASVGAGGPTTSVAA